MEGQGGWTYPLHTPLGLSGFLLRGVSPVQGVVLLDLHRLHLLLDGVHNGSVL